MVERLDLPADWLRKLAEKHLTPEERAEIEALGGFDKLMETLAQRLAAQQGRHQGGSKWIGTAGTSPFGAFGYNPEGVRIGQDERRHRRAVKVWDRREFRNLDDPVELGTRNIKLALRRLRRWAREGAADELDLGATIRRTAEQGGSMSLPGRSGATRSRCCSFSTSAGRWTRTSAWSRSCSLRREQSSSIWNTSTSTTPLPERLERQPPPLGPSSADGGYAYTFGPDYRAILVGDAAMSPDEINQAGGASEHWNAESG